MRFTTVQFLRWLLKRRRKRNSISATRIDQWKGATGLTRMVKVQVVVLVVLVCLIMDLVCLTMDLEGFMKVDLSMAGIKAVFKVSAGTRSLIRKPVQLIKSNAHCRI